MVQEFLETFRQWALSFGAIEGDSGNCYLRRNIVEDAYVKGGAYFGYVQPEEGASGAYHDFSLVVFPDNNRKEWIVSLCIGSLGFRNDYELAALPGIRRRFRRLISENGWLKTSFLDIERSIEDKGFIERVPHLRDSLRIYGKFIPACEIVNPETKLGQDKIKGFLAQYADLRGWGTNAIRRSTITSCIIQAQNSETSIPDCDNAMSLLKHRKFLVLQGPPGTGKTRLSKLLANQLQAETFFTQFHAETSYAEFVSGLRPKLHGDQVGYEVKEGVLIQAIREALATPSKNVLLIIDEINRANLANVLGPVFYLFEYQMESSSTKIKLADDLTIDRLPNNFYVVATMNTADRSLAVVDFALRRRFAWFTLWPKEIQLSNHLKFYSDYYGKVSEIFELYANDEELNLQPGQGYFIARTDDEMKNRMKYEVLPLIKEYLTEGLLSSSKEAFSNYFHQLLKEDLFR